MVDYNPFSDEVVYGDPLPIYKRLRDEAPAYYLAEFDTWALSRFEDIWKASADMKNLTAANGTTSAHLLTKVQPVTPMINNMDAPDHTRLRAEFRKAFAAPEVARLEPMIRRIAKERLAAVSRRRPDGRDPRLLGPRRRHRRLHDQRPPARRRRLSQHARLALLPTRGRRARPDRGRPRCPDRDVRLLPRADRAATTPGREGRRPAEAPRVPAGREAPRRRRPRLPSLDADHRGLRDLSEDARHDRAPARAASGSAAACASPIPR